MRFLPFLTVLSTLGLGACIFDASVAREGASSTTGDAGSRPEADGGSRPGTDAGTGDAASSDGTPDPGPVKAGAVFASIIPPTPGNPSGSTFAFGIFSDGVTRASSCLSRDEGVCKVVTCPLGASPTARATPKQAGTLDVGGISVAWNPLQSQYLYTSQPGMAWTAGQKISLGAAGGDISGFSGSVTFPEQLVISSPGYSPGIRIPLPVSKAAGIPLTWATTVSDVDIALSEYRSEGGPTIDVRCTVPAPSSGFTVPAGAIRGFSTVPIASGGPHRNLQVQTIATKSLVVDGYAVTLAASVAGATWEPQVSP